MSFVGNKLDVIYESMWHIGTIIEVNDNKIKVHYDCDNDDNSDDHWVDINSDTIAKLHTRTTPINSLPKPPISTAMFTKIFTAYYNYAHDGSKYIILCANNWEIYRYDVITNNWEKYSEYPDEFVRYLSDDDDDDDDYTDYGINDVCFDGGTFNLHLVHIEPYGTIIHAKLNVIEKTWKVFELQRYGFSFEDADLAYTGRNELHVFPVGLGEHYKISGAECIKVVDNTDDESLSNNYCVIWCEALQKLVKTNRHSIFVCDEYKQNVYNWTKLDIAIDATHLKMDAPLVILAYKYIIFAFCGTSNKICCIDLLHEKWYKVSKYVEINTSCDTAITKGDGNYVYITDCDYNSFERISLLDIIPVEMQFFWKNKRSKPLILGYINMISNKYKLSNSIPYDIVNLILHFYPTFCD